MATNWEYTLEPIGEPTAGQELENKFDVRGELGWEYAGLTKDPDGAEYYVWKRPRDE